MQYTWKDVIRKGSILLVKTIWTIILWYGLTIFILQCFRRDAD